MALSFEQSYNIESIKELLPSELTLVWYWVNTFNEEDLDKMERHYTELIEQDGQPTGEKQYQSPKVLLANQIYGMKTATDAGEDIKDPYNSFFDAIKFGVNNKSRYQPQFKELYNKLINNGEIKRDNIRIIGVVVTGDANSLKLLKDASYIKATSLGIV